MRALAAAVLVAALAGCGGHKPPAAAVSPSPTSFPPALQTADCDEWHELRPASRLALVTQMQIFFGGKVSETYGRGQTLGTDQTLRLFAQQCKPQYAGRVKLYKLYGRAAAFTPAG